MTKVAKTLGVLGSLLLLATAAFHFSGYAHVGEAISQSDVSAFLKRAVPGLWLHFSIHLAFLAAAAFWGALRGGIAVRPIFIFLAVAVAVDTVVVFMLAGFFAGVGLLGAAALCLAAAAAAVRIEGAG